MASLCAMMLDPSRSARIMCLNRFTSRDRLDFSIALRIWTSSSR